MIANKLSTAVALALALGATTALAQTQQSGAKQMASGECPDQFAALDGNKEITSQEARAVRLKVFASLDANKDDIVSREEYVRCLASTSAFMIAGVAGLGGRPDEMGLLNRTEARFTSIDTSNDKKISWGEYMKAAQEDYRRFGRMSGRTEQGASAAAGWAFARMDSDLSGEIEMKEWAADAGLSGMADKSFQTMDANKDGRIAQDEYQAVLDKASMPAK